MCEPSYVGVTWCYNEDRKSTRLNSSHGYISYAVFCLKKKKKDRVLSLSLLYLVEPLDFHHIIHASQSPFIALPCAAAKYFRVLSVCSFLRSRLTCDTC